MDKKEINNTNVDETKKVQSTNKDSEYQADFSSIFSVESEEKVPVKDNKAKLEAPEMELPKENPIKKTPEEKAQNRKSTFNNDERILYEILPEKEGNPIVPVIVFSLLIIFILILPIISKNIIYNTHLWTEEEPIVETPAEEVFYHFNKSTVRATIGDLEFTNFVKSYVDDVYRVSFIINNVGERTFQFDKKYYIVMYEENKIIYRALIHSYEAIGSMAAQDIDLIISEYAYKNAEKFKIEEIKEAVYPSVKLNKFEGEYGILECNYKNDNIKYYFLNGKLAKISETYKEETANNSSYETNKAYYKALSNRYKAVNGLNSTFIETNTDFTMLNSFELKNITDYDISRLQTYKFFKYNETKEIVSFELEAQGYLCS